jgi:hypothetical protein
MIKKTFVTFALSIGLAVITQAATFIVDNVGNGVGDTLFADTSNSPLTSGFAAIGYFDASVNQTDIDTIQKLHAILQPNNPNPPRFTVVASAAIGFAANSIGNGYANGTGNNVGQITVGNPLLGRSIYTIVTNQTSLEAFAAAQLNSSNQVGLLRIGQILNDVPAPQIYNGNPANKTVIIGTPGSVDSFTTELGTGEYPTFALSAVPETSTTLLGALGALAMLRRRRR